MNKKRVFTIFTIFVVLCFVVYFFVFRVSGSSSSMNIDGCNPYNVEINKGDKEHSVEISWKSKKECSAYIIYGSEMKNLNLIGIDLNNEIKSREHVVILNSLVSSKTYFFSIVSEGITYGKNGLPISFSISSL